MSRWTNFFCECWPYQLGKLPKTQGVTRHGVTDYRFSPGTHTWVSTLFEHANRGLHVKRTYTSSLLGLEKKEKDDNSEKEKTRLFDVIRRAFGHR